MAFKSSASPGSYSQVIDGNVAFSKTRKLQDANQTRAQQRQRHTKLLADRNRNHQNSLLAAQRVEGQSRQLALASENRLRQEGARLEGARIEAGLDSAVRNAQAKAGRSIAAAKELEGFINSAIGTGLNIYKQQEENRIKQGTRDLNVLTLKYGISATEHAGIRNLTQEMWQDQGRKDGLAFKLRERGMTWHDVSRIQGAPQAAHAAVAINTVTSQISSSANNFRVSTDIVPGTDMTPGQLLQEGTQESVNQYNVGFRNYTAGIIEAAEKLGVTDFGPFIAAVQKQEAINNSYTSKLLEANARQRNLGNINQALISSFPDGSEGVTRLLRSVTDGAAEEGRGPQELEQYIGQLSELAEQGLTPIGTYDAVRQMQLGNGFTVETHGRFNDELLTLLKAERAARTGEHTDFRQEAQAAERNLAETHQEFANLDPATQREVFPTIAAKIKRENSWNAEPWIAKFQAELEKNPTPNTEAQRNVEILRGKYGVETIPSNKLLGPYPITEHEKLKKQQRIARTTHENLPGHLKDEINDLGGRRITFAAPDVGIEGDPGESWFKKEVRKQYWADVEHGVFNKGLTAEQAHAEALQNFKAEFNEKDPFGKGGRYEIWDASEPEAKGRTGFKYADQAKVPITDQVVWPSDIIKATKDPNNVQWETFTSVGELKGILDGNPNATSLNKLIHARNNLGQQSKPMSEFAGDVYKELTGKDYPVQVRTGGLSEASKEFLEGLDIRRLPPNTTEYPIHGNSRVPYTGDRDNQETGTDHVFQGGIGAPLILGVPARIGIPEDGFHHAYTEPNTGGKSFGHTISVVVPLRNGNEVDFMIGHLNERSPLYGLSPGTIIPAGTSLGGQGMSGSTSGGPVATMHANGRNGYKATPEDLMWIIRSMQGIAGGNQ